MGGRLKRQGIYVSLWLICIVVWQKPINIVKINKQTKMDFLLWSLIHKHLKNTTSSLTVPVKSRSSEGQSELPTVSGRLGLGGRPPHQHFFQDPSAGLGACLQATPHPQGPLAASGRPGVRSEAWTQGEGGDKCRWGCSPGDMAFMSRGNLRHTLL